MGMSTSGISEKENRGALRAGPKRGLVVGFAVGFAMFGIVALGAALQGCGGGSGPVACNVAPAVGASWTIDKKISGAQLSCAQAGADIVQLTLNNVPFRFTCDDGQGLTTTLQPGTYNADFSLIGPDASNNDQFLSQTDQMTIVVGSCGVTDVGDVLFDVN